MLLLLFAQAWLQYFRTRLCSRWAKNIRPQIGQTCWVKESHFSALGWRFQNRRRHPSEQNFLGLPLGFCVMGWPHMGQSRWTQQDRNSFISKSSKPSAITLTSHAAAKPPDFCENTLKRHKKCRGGFCVRLCVSWPPTLSHF